MRPNESNYDKGVWEEKDLKVITKKTEGRRIWKWLRGRCGQGRENREELGDFGGNRTA